MAEPALDVSGNGVDLQEAQIGNLYSEALEERRTSESIPTIKGDEDFAKIRPGQKFIDPTGKMQTRLYEVKNDEDFSKVPEGAEFLGPDGKQYKKPTFESIGFTGELLYSMAQTDDAKEQALRKVFGDKVKKDPALGLYVDDDGVIRKPGARDPASRLGIFTSELAPATGMGLGTAVGGTLGSAGGPFGTALGSFGGMVTGAALGRQVNNTILALAGIHQSPGEQLSSAAWEGASAAGGEVIGKGASRVIRAVAKTPGLLSSAGEKARTIAEDLGGTLESMGITAERARNFLGTTKQAAEQAADITARGGKVPPSILAPGAPMLTKVEEFDAVFSGVNRFAEANRDFYEKEAKSILENDLIGVKVDTPLTAATKRVSSQQAGQLALAAAQRDMAIADAELENATRAYKDAVWKPVREAGGEEGMRALHQEALTRLQNAQKNAAEAARRLVDEGVSDLRQDINGTLQLLKHNEDPSALSRVVEAKFDGYNAATRQRARQLYDVPRTIARGAPPPDVSSLAADAEAFLRSMPEAMRAKYPAEIADLARLIDRDVEIPGVRKAAELPEGQTQEPLDWAGLHHLRSWFRHGIDYADLTPDMRTGALKSFERKINSVLHDQQHPELKRAAQELDRADAFYKETVPFLRDEMVTSVMKSLESGAGVNASVIARFLFDPERIAALRKARSIVGENAWRAVEAAHVDNMLSQSKTLVPGEIDFNKFQQQVLEDVRNGLIDEAYSPQMAARLRKLTTQMGQLDGSIPISVEPTDTLSTIMRRGVAAKEAADKAANLDPIKALAKEMARLDREFNVAQRELKAGRRKEPLGFLYEQSMSQMAVKAADKILGSQDLIVAAANQFGRDSAEFHALQQVYVHRFFQRPAGKIGTMRAELGEEHKGMTEELQALMFPGVTRSQMLGLVKDAEFLFGGGRGIDFGGSMAAAARVLNPTAHIPIPKLSGPAGFLAHGPLVAPVHRFMLQKLYATAMDAVSHPNFVNWLAERLKGNEAERQMARAAVQQRLRLGGWFGAAIGQTAYSGPSSVYNQPPADNRQ